MRFEVPQFIEVEDKIIGPFTWKQFIYLAGGGGAAVVLFFTLPFFLFAILATPIVGLAGFLAFHQVNNRPFSDFLESGFNYFTRNKLYLWRKGTEQTVSAKVTMAVPEDTRTATHLPSPTKNNLAALSRKLELNALGTNESAAQN